MINSLLDVPAVADYLHRINADVRSLRTAVIKKTSGKYWKDVSIIRFTKDGEVKADEEYAPDDAERKAIKEQFNKYEWPHIVHLVRPPNMPEELRNGDPKVTFEYRDTEGKLIMMQQRQVINDRRVYVPYTFWNDEVWRKMEPDRLPLWGLQGIKDQSTVFIHEGAKAAAHMQWMMEGETKSARDAWNAFPWKKEMSGAAHVGWTGGALSPERTDWSPLTREGIKYAYIVADNDSVGRSVIPNIARMLHCTTFSIQFSEQWPATFDMADEWPKKMFEEVDGKRFYIGPSFRECKHPATWATDMIPNPKGKGKDVPRLRSHFKELWAYVEGADLFICTEMPDNIMNDKIFNNHVKAFSHVSVTTELLHKSYNGRQTSLCYRPDIPERMIVNQGRSSINLHIPSTIEASEGDPKPWLDFMDYMFPKKEDRDEMLRWCATLIARPDIHMEYGVLLVSETQGVGKTTLGQHILAPLVGINNVSHPSETDITNSDFNEWLAQRRLAVIGEIYAGHSWKAYNKLKSFITDTSVRINQKFQKEYTIENWCHFFACSNSKQALKMEDDDRRWFYPEVTEKRWPDAKFDKFHRWIKSGGLQIIKWWAENWTGGYVLIGQRAPMTVQKKELIEASRTEAQKEATDLAVAMIRLSGPKALAMKDVESYVKRAVKSKVFDSDADLRRAMKEVGALTLKKRMFVDGRLQYVIVNEDFEKGFEEIEDDKLKREYLSKHLTTSNEVLFLSF